MPRKNAAPKKMALIGATALTASLFTTPFAASAAPADSAPAAESATPAAATAPMATGVRRWYCLAHHEASGRWGINTGNGYYGGLQFSKSTWRYYGGVALTGKVYPNKARKKAQIRIGRRAAWKGWKGKAPQGGGSAWPNTWYRCF